MENQNVNITFQLPGKIGMNLRTSLTASLIILFFFMPWINFGLGSVSGWQILSLANKIGELATKMTGEEMPSSNGKFILFYFIPISASILLYNCYLNSTKKIILFEFVTISSVFISTVILLNVDNITSEWLGYGFYGLIIFTLLLSYDLVTRLGLNQNKVKTDNEEIFEQVIPKQIESNKKLSPEDLEKMKIVEAKAKRENKILDIILSLLVLIIILCIIFLK